MSELKNKIYDAYDNEDNEGLGDLLIEAGFNKEERNKVYDAYDSGDGKIFGNVFGPLFDSIRETDAVVEEKSLPTQIKESMFPRYTKGIEEGRDVINPVDIESGEIGSFLPGVSNKQLAAAFGDMFSLSGRVASGLAGNIKRLIEGDLTAEEMIKANLEDIGQTHGTDTQNVVLKFVEDYIRDPALLPSLATGGAVGALTKPVEAIRKFKGATKLANTLPYLKRGAQGAAAGVADVGVQDYMNDYAMDEDRIQLSDYALGGTVGAVMPGLADKSKALGEKVYNVMKGAKAVPVPPKQFSQFKPAQEDFGIGADDIGFNKDVKMTDDGPDTYKPLLNKGKTDQSVHRVPDWVEDYEEFHPGSNELETMSIADMLKQGPSQAVVNLTEVGESKMAPFLNKTVRGYNAVAEPVVNFGVDFANLINKPIYGGYNLGNKARAAGVRFFAPNVSEALKNSAYRYPTDATILRDQFQDEEGN